MDVSLMHVRMCVSLMHVRKSLTQGGRNRLYQATKAVASTFCSVLSMSPIFWRYCVCVCVCVYVCVCVCVYAYACVLSATVSDLSRGIISWI